MYFLSYVFALSSINSENINCVIESKITIYAIYENDVKSIDIPNTIGKNIFNIYKFFYFELANNLERLISHILDEL